MNPLRKFKIWFEAAKKDYPFLDSLPLTYLPAIKIDHTQEWFY